MMNLTRSTLAMVAAIAAVPAVAQDAGPVDPNARRDTVTVGAGVATVPSYEGSNNNRIVPAVAARGSISGFSFATRGTKLFIDAIPDQPGPVIDFELGPVISLNFNRVGRKSIDDDRVEALGTKKLAVELGGYVGIGKTGVITSDYDKLSASVAYVHDVSDIHDSYTWTPQVDYFTPLSRKAFVGLSGNAVYAGRGYAREYFTVSPLGSVRSGLPVYYADKGWKNYSISGLGGYSITGDLLGGLAIVGGVSYSRLLNDFADSPVTRIAGDRDQWYGALGLAYTF